MKYSYVKHYKFKLEETEMRETLILGFEFNTRYMAMLDNGQFFAKYSYIWDGSSIPYKKMLRVLSLWLYDADKYCKIAGLIHDGLCQAIREGLLPKHLKEKIDLLYRTMCIEGRMAAYEKKLEEKLAKKPTILTKKIEKKRQQYKKKTERWAERRYKALRRFGDVGIEPEKNPRNQIFTT